MRSTELARELDAFRDEPPQLPSGSMGKDAFLRLRFERREERSILAVMERRAPLLVQRALYCDEGMPGIPYVPIISNAGGILQGDRYTMKFEVAAEACGHITTQAATKIHEMDANFAAQTQEISLDEGAYLEYLPDQIIPFRNSRFHTQTRIRIAPSASFLYSEILVGGRKYYLEGELFQFDLYSSTVKAERPDGRELFTERFVIEPKAQDVRQIGLMGKFDVFANVVLLTPKPQADQIAPEVEVAFDRKNQLAFGLSRLPNDAGLIYKVLGMEANHVREKVRLFWSIVRPIIAQFPVPAEFPWR